MYDPTIGQWLSEDPIGFSAHDTNLKRYVSNQPVSDLDPSGFAPVDDIYCIQPSHLDDVLPRRPIGGTTYQLSPVLVDNEVVKIVAHSGARVLHENGDTTTGAIWIEAQLPSGSKINSGELHWVQFTVTHRYDAAGNSVQELRTTAAGNGVVDGQWHIDSPQSQPNKPYSPYYDCVAMKHRTASSLAIIDAPTVGRPSGKVVRSESNFESYLVYRGQVYYVVKWSTTWALDASGSPIMSFGQVTGGPTSEPSEALNTPTVVGGWYNDEGRNKMYMVINPIYSPLYDPASH